MPREALGLSSLRRLSSAHLAIVAAGVCLTPTFAAAATQQDLEARVQALAEQLEVVKAELAALKDQRAAAPPGSALPQGSVAAIPAAPPGPGVPYSSSGGQGGGPTFFGYGEFNYSRPREDAAATKADVARFVLGIGYRFDERTRFVSELEVEHAVSSASDVGEVAVEQAYIERELRGGIYAKAGLVLIPSGLLNENHEPTRYYGVFRNFVETAIIPTTWREGGVALQGTTGRGLRWDVGVTTGFDLSKWNAAATDGQNSPLGSIHQELALAHARDLSGFAAVNYTGVSAFRIGASVFTGGASQGQPGLPSSSVTLWEGHTRWAPGAWDLAALYARGHIGGTREINTALIGNPTLIPESFFGWYLQAAYRLMDTGSSSLAPFVRYERFNTASAFVDIATGLTPAALPDRKVWTAGLNWMIAPGVVIKADYQDFQSTSRGDRFDLGLGYQF